MDISSLIATGLTHQQAAAYAILIELGEVKPPELAKHLKTTRTNAYKLLDKLVELKLAAKTDKAKKISYVPANPIALAGLGVQFRAEATAREEAINTVMQELLAKYHKHSDEPAVTQATGRKEVAAAYRKQLALREDIYFIHAPSDVSLMGFDVMHDIRTTPARHNNNRHGILKVPKGPINQEGHKRSNLDITWMEQEAYTSPVEWSVTNSSLLIVLYATEPHAILIVDPVVAAAFMQIWYLLSSLLRQQKAHISMIEEISKAK